ncbi:hypothetical protein [Saccharopolyspora sp. 5N708]|uniref:hypothetical protein n=1 Tax=Saccharopolyspora sp. 5N708 TaxID=3457424 RepID=UPI003FD325D1
MVFKHFSTQLVVAYQPGFGTGDGANSGDGCVAQHFEFEWQQIVASGKREIQE